MALSPTTIAAIAAQSAELGDWLMPVGAAVGTATALLIRFRRGKQTSNARGSSSQSRRQGG